MKTIITIDYDQTLSIPSTQEYIKELLNDPKVECYVLTARYDDLNKHSYQKNPSNEDLWLTIDKLLIPREKVVFMNMKSKGKYLNNTKVFAHLDNCTKEIADIKTHSNTETVNVNNPQWKQQLETLISIHQKLARL